MRKWYDKKKLIIRFIIEGYAVRVNYSSIFFREYQLLRYEGLEKIARKQRFPISSWNIPRLVSSLKRPLPLHRYTVYERSSKFLVTPQILARAFLKQILRPHPLHAKLKDIVFFQLLCIIVSIEGSPSSYFLGSTLYYSLRSSLVRWMY